MDYCVLIGIGEVQICDWFLPMPHARCNGFEGVAETMYCAPVLCHRYYRGSTALV